MKKQIFILAAAVACLAGTTSCSDFLDSKNKSTVSADDYFTSETSWNQLLNQAYFKMRDVYSNPTLFCMGTDIYTHSQGGSALNFETYQFDSNDGEPEDFYKSAYAAINAANCVLKYSGNAKYNDQARFIRDYCYYLLTQQFGRVPYITEYIESASTSYPRTDLATIYQGLENDLKEIISGGNLEEVSSPADGKGRASVIAAKALLAKVYLAAGWDLQTTLTDATKGTYSVTSTDYFSKAAALAAEVANAVPLSQTFEKKWEFDLNEAGNNTETLFAIQYDRATATNQIDGGHSQQHYFGGYLGSVNLGVKGMKNDLCPNERAFYVFDKGDSRFESTFMTTIYAYGDDDDWATNGYWAFYNATDAQKANLSIAWKFFPWYATTAEIDAYRTANAAKFVTTGKRSATKIISIQDEVKSWDYNEDGTIKDNQPSVTPFDNAIGSIGYIPPVRKFDDKNTPKTVSQSGGDYRDVVIMDASEIYLVAAEAYLLAGDKTNALKYLNAVRDRSNAGHLNAFSDYKVYDYEAGAYVSFGSSLINGITINELDVILDEKIRENIGEFYRWMDLRRTRQLVRYNVAYKGLTVAGMTGPDGNIKWLRPIPSLELELNSAMRGDQNPGFQVSAKAEDTSATEETK